MTEKQALMEAIMADSDGKSADPRVVLARVTELCRSAADAQRRVDEAEAALKKETAALQKIERIDIPELLREAGLKTLTLVDGTKVDVVDEISCSITKANEPEAHAWLREHGGGGIIKMNVTVAFGKDQVDSADELTLELVKRFGDEMVEEVEKVHHSTLKSYLKERIASSAAKVESGEEQVVTVPFELFSIEPYSVAKIKLPKKSGKL